MRVLAVPVKALHRGKRRLSGILSPSERSRLVLAMFHGVLDAAVAQEGWATWVVSPSEAVLSMAERAGARPVVDTAVSLGGALRAMEADLARPEEVTLAVLLADLPLVTPSSLRLALRDALRSPVAAVAAHSDGGTNLLVRRPATAIPSRFGRASFERHRAEAVRAGLAFIRVESAELAFDVDTPEDVARWMSEPTSGPAFRQAVALGLPERTAAPATR
jgi:2-phospho-L-lactate/phosphoenolpyruvate guanylyltransferase